MAFAISTAYFLTESHFSLTYNLGIWKFWDWITGYALPLADWPCVWTPNCCPPILDYGFYAANYYYDKVKGFGVFVVLGRGVVIPRWDIGVEYCPS